MAEPTTKTEFKAWCKRKLGYPVIDINVDDDQVDDRVDEAIQYWNTFMQNGMQRMYLKHKLTADDVQRAKTNAVETAVAKGTGASEISTSILGTAASSSDTTVTLADASTFPTQGQIKIAADGTNAEEIVTYTAKTGNVLTTSALTLDHLVGSAVTLYVSATWGIGQDYIPMPDGILSVLRILPFTDRGNLNMFDIRYQLRLNDLYDFSDISVIHYQMTMWQLDLLDMLLVGEKPINFNVHAGRLYIDMAWATDMDIGEYIIMECYRKLNTAEYSQAYNELF